MVGTDRENRREQSRTPAGYLVQLQPVDPATPGVRSGTRFYVTRDISRDGMGLWVDFIYPLRARLLLTFEHAVGAVDSVTSRIGSVAWVDPVPIGGRHMLGIRFVNGDVTD